MATKYDSLPKGHANEIIIGGAQAAYPPFRNQTLSAMVPLMITTSQMSFASSSAKTSRTAMVPFDYELLGVSRMMTATHTKAGGTKTFKIGTTTDDDVIATGAAFNTTITNTKGLSTWTATATGILRKNGSAGEVLIVTLPAVGATSPGGTASISFFVKPR